MRSGLQRHPVAGAPTRAPTRRSRPAVTPLGQTGHVTDTVPRWVALLEGAALVWGAALLTALAVLSRLREPSTVVIGTPGGGTAARVVETPVLQLQGALPYLPGALVVVCAGAALAVTLLRRWGPRLRPDLVCWCAAVLVLAVGLVGILTIVLAVLPAAALLGAAAARLSDARRADRLPGARQ